MGETERCKIGAQTAPLSYLQFRASYEDPALACLRGCPPKRRFTWSIARPPPHMCDQTIADARFTGSRRTYQYVLNYSKRLRGQPRSRLGTRFTGRILSRTTTSLRLLVGKPDEHVTTRVQVHSP